MIRPSRGEGNETNYASNYAGLNGKHIVVVDDVVSSGSTATEAIDFVRKEGGIPVLVTVLINKKANDEIKKLAKDGLSEDLARDAENSVQDLTNSYSKKIDDIFAKKEADIMTV